MESTNHLATKGTPDTTTNRTTNTLAHLIPALTILLLATPAILFAQLPGKIAFESCVNNACDIYLINPDATGQVRVTFNNASDRQPSLNAIGTKIAFVSNRDGGSEIYTMNLDGSNQTRLTNNTGIPDIFPAFSPDGSKIA